MCLSVLSCTRQCSSKPHHQQSGQYLGWHAPVRRHTAAPNGAPVSESSEMITRSDSASASSSTADHVRCSKLPSPSYRSGARGPLDVSESIRAMIMMMISRHVPILVRGGFDLLWSRDSAVKACTKLAICSFHQAPPGVGSLVQITKCISAESVSYPSCAKLVQDELVSLYISQGVSVHLTPWTRCPCYPNPAECCSLPF